MRNLYFKLIILLLVIIPLNYVDASSEIMLECPNSGVLGSELVCSLKGYSDTYVSSLSAKLKVDGNIEFVGFNTNSIWMGDGNNGDIELYTDVNKTGEFSIGTITVRLSINDNGRNGIVLIEDISYYDDKFKEIVVSDISSNIKILSMNNYLASVSLIGYNISPAFNKDVFEYSATVDSDIVVIEANSEDSRATISGIGTKNLNYGVNKYIITVTNEAGGDREYKLVITRPNKEEKENDSLDEKADDITQDNINQEVVTNDKEAIEEIKKSADSRLKILNIEGYDIEFNSDMYKYYINISSSVESLVIEGIANNEKATVEIIGNDNLVFGNNEIIVTVTAEDGSKSIYTIYATKKSDFCVVESISVMDYDLKFDCNKYNYELEIWDETSLNIDVNTVNGQGSVNIYNNDNLKHEDVIKIVVTVDGIDYKYNIKVLKNVFELEEFVKSKQLIFAIVILVCTLLYLMIRFFIKKRSKKVDVE